MNKRREYRLYGKRRTSGRKFARIGVFVLILFGIYLIIDSLLIESISTDSASMLPTIAPGERILASPLLAGARVPFSAAKLRPIQKTDRGDIVVVQPPYARTTVFRRLVSPFVSFFTLNKIRFEPVGDMPFEAGMLIRRVIALPGDTVRVDGYTAYIRPPDTGDFTSEFDLIDRRYSISTEPLPEGWSGNLPLSGSSDEFTLGDDEYFVLSDNRSSANDSRYWGAVNRKQIVSRILLRYWPFEHFGVPR